MPLTPGRFTGQVLDLRATSSQRGMPSTTVAGVGGVGFSPLHLPGLALWLDAADTSTITSSSGAVSQWNDKSGLGRNFSQSTSASQPTTGSVTQNGLNVIDFDGSADYLDGGNIINEGTFGYTIAAVAKLDTATGLQGIAGKSRASADAGRCAVLFDAASGYFGGLWDEQAGASGQSGQFVAYDPGVSDRTVATAWIMTARRRWTTLFLRNGVQVGTPYLNPAGTGGLTMGANNWYVGAYQTSTGNAPSASSYLDGWVGEVCCWDRALSVSEIGQLNAYLMGKWGL